MVKYHPCRFWIKRKIRRRLEVLRDNPRLVDLVEVDEGLSVLKKGLTSRLGNFFEKKEKGY